MSLKAIVDNIEEIAEPIRNEYVKDEATGKYRLDVESVDGYVLEDTSTLKKTLEKVRKESKDNEKLYKSLKDKFGDLDPEDAREKIAQLDELLKLDPKTEAERLAQEKIESEKKKIEKQLNKQWESKINTEYEPMKKRYGTVEAMLRKELVESAAVKAIASEGGNVDLLLPHIKDKIKFNIDEEGKTEVYLVGSDGEPVYDSKGQHMSFNEYVAALKPKFPGAFTAGGKGSGGGSRGSEGGGKGTNSGLSPIQEGLLKLRQGESFKNLR